MVNVRYFNAPIWSGRWNAGRPTIAAFAWHGTSRCNFCPANGLLSLAFHEPLAGLP
jgi:hypothetical protein